MNDKQPRPLGYTLAAAVAERLPGRFPMKKSALLFLQDTGTLDGLAALFSLQARLTCAQVLEGCAPALEKLAPQAPEGGWLAFCYRLASRTMFPGSFDPPGTEAQREGGLFFLTVLQVLLDQERAALPFDPLMDFQFLPEEVSAACEKGGEYRRFLAAWREEFLYELMRLGIEVTPFCTLSHIAGVHYIALHAAQGLADAGVEVDLALISGAAAAHDVGKFGCRPGERVPYLHYYYTDQWLLERRMEGISHIAANHSVWDLELESLSVESLLLIYADFRSKQGRAPDGTETTVLYSLEDSFRVILSKLDNVDRSKRRRYEFVYGKLHDFEDYMRSLGVDVDLTGHPQPPAPRKDPALMDPDETLEGLILLSVEHNLKLMHLLSNERKFGNIIEAARSAKSWQQLRAYLNIFGEYFTYLSVRQKTQALAFLYELLVHREGDIRRQAAALIGQIIARFHLVYRKEIPADAQHDPAEEVPFTLWSQYLDLIVYPDHKTTPQQRAHIGYTLKLVVDSLLLHARPGDIPRFLGALLHYYDRPAQLDSDTAFTLLDAIRYLPSRYYDETVQTQLIDFAAHFAASGDLRLETAALEFLRETQRTLPQSHPLMARITAIARAVSDEHLTTRFLQYRILRRAGEQADDLKQILYRSDITSEVFLDNLKTATPWVVKVAGVELLRDQVEAGVKDHILHIATHFSNLVKVSERVVVRHTAGQALVSLLPTLRRDQRNEVVVELGKGLEMGQYEISKYIPQYLGEAALFLHPSELDEQVLWLKDLLGSPNDSAVSGALNTVGVLLQHYPAYRERFPQSETDYEARRRELLGLLLLGLAHYREAVRQEALLVTGKLLFEAPVLPMDEKARLFALCYRKLLFLAQGGNAGSLTFFYRAAALAHINRFIALHRLDHGPFTFEKPRLIAFFPGTFDPFTLSHKGIVRAIRDRGFEVLLAIDEFSWSKRTQPYRIRRRIAAMSVADEFHVHIFPEDFPVNIANPENLRRLREAFPGRPVSIVVGSDVVAHASSYQKPVEPDSIHSFDHVIFRRDEVAGPVDYGCIRGRVVELTLPPQLEEISSTRIREAVDANRDISRLVDPAVQDFIYRRGLYLREPQDKPMLQTEDLEFSVSQHPAEELLPLLRELGPDGSAVARAVSESGDQAVLLHRSGSSEPLGAVTFRCLDSQMLYARLKSPQLTGLVRQSTGGRALLISGVLVPRGEQQEEFGQLLLTEVLTLALSREYAYGLYCPLEGAASAFARQLILRQGFVAVAGEKDALAADMRRPLVLSRNVDTAIKQPLASRPAVAAAVSAARIRLQEALTGLYPGNLVLSLSAGVIYHRLLQRITARNGVPAEPLVPRQLGPDICVPYGKILRGVTVPNTVTKTLRTDKVYEPDLSAYSIEAYPGYSPLPDQVRTIRAFDRPVILVDDMLHDGKRIRRLAPLLEQTHTRVDQVLVGYLTGMGRDLMEQLGYPVDSIYYLPNLRRWFVESTLYPFIGGDTVRRTGLLPGGLQPSVNRILPYASPELPDVDSRAVWQLSLCCLENARDILLALEAEYRSLYARNLTLARLGEAVILPLCPDKGPCMTYDLTRAASTYLDGDIEQLRRMR